MEISDLLKRTGEWMSGSGPEGDIVISSRARLARNLNGFRFVNRADLDELRVIESAAAKAVREARLISAESYFNLSRLAELDRQLLLERHLVSKELVAATGDRSLLFDGAESVALMINEEDHIRMQAIHSGFRLGEAYERVKEFDEVLGKKLNYAYSPRYGFLTACPTNVGTGLRVSVMMHLPGLVLSRQIDKVFRAVGRLKLAVRGLFGEGSSGMGDLFQVSNQVTLGVGEAEIIDGLSAVVVEILKYERAIRDEFATGQRMALEDKVYRAHAVLANARKLRTDELIELLSAVRLGVNMGLIVKPHLPTINEMFLFSQPAHLQKRVGTELGAEDRDVERARYVRARMN